MSTQASVQSIDALKDFRVALALFAEDTLAALGAVDMEVRRTVMWVQHDRRTYWQEQIKRRREQVAMAKAEVFRRKLAKTPDHTPAYTEQKELLRQAEARLRDAETRAALIRKWEPALQQAVLEYHGTTRRIKDLASGDIPRALVKLERMIDALEAYLRVAVPSGASGQPAFESVANTILDDETIAPAPTAAPEPVADSSATCETEALPPTTSLGEEPPPPPA
jgi:hypothetical protein